jgi:hypothetical protein
LKRLKAKKLAPLTESLNPVSSARMHRLDLQWSHSFAALIGTLALSPSALAQGTAAQFQGVERWQGNYTYDIDITLAGTRKHRSGSTKFVLDKHRVEGSTEIWEGKIKSKESDEDQAGVFSGTLVGGKTADLKLILDMNSDMAKLASHSEASKHKMTMKIMGQKIQSMDVEQPAQDGSAETPIAEGAESLVFAQETGASTDVHMKSVITLTPSEVPLRAVLTAGSARRGSKTTLDASRSKGRIKTFKWTLRPLGESGAPSVNFETREAKVELVLLEDVGVDLEVSDGRKKAKTSGTAKVIARQWITRSTPDSNDGTLDGEHLFSLDSVPEAINHFGQDACAFEGRDSGHGMHASHPGTWKDDASAGYKVGSVEDPGRPFDGYWYVTEQSLIVKRRALFNPDLMKGSVLFQVNKDHGTSEPFARLVAASRAHEYLHGELIRREVLNDDPAKRIEKLVRPSEERLATFADMEIRATETRMQEGKFHEQEVRDALKNKYGTGGTVWVRGRNRKDGSPTFAPWTIASFADKGE